MNIDVYCLCWNEAKIIPFVIQYWKRFARHVYVYDNGSDDGSIELLSQYPDWITVRRFESDGFNDIVNKEIKNNCWKDSDADWVCVCDMDECLYAKDIFGEIEKLESEKGISIISPQWGDIYSTDFPEYDENKLCHEVVGGVVLNSGIYVHKYILFKPSEIKEINFGPGAHFCNPVGTGNKCLCQELYIVHLKNLSEQYKIERCKILNQRLSSTNKKYGFGIHYAMSEEKIREEFKENLSKVKSID